MKPVLLCLLATAFQASILQAEKIESSPLYIRYQKYQDIDLHFKRLVTEETQQEGNKLRDDLASSDPHRLPQTLRPLEYDLSLQVYHWGNRTFLGTVAIRLEALEDTDTITLNSAKLDIRRQDVTVTDSSQQSVTVTRLDRVPKHEQLHINVRPALKAGSNYTLTIHYSGSIRSDVLGLYMFGYVDESKTVRMVAATQLQTTYARHVLPCFDEPSFKARFTLHLARPTNSTAISNTALVKTAPFLGHPDYEWDTFGTTPPMSSYLLAFVISQFKTLSTTQNGVDYRVFLKGDHYKQGQLMIDTTPRLLQFFENFYGIPYPFKKLDSVGIQRMAAAGMENWGAITYHEDAVRISNTSTPRQVVYATNLIAHEVAHQWFGNLVTAKWWSDIWLNEGFATYMAIKALERMEPQWEAMKLFVSGHQMAALAMDSTNLSTPIIQNVSTLSEIENSFNTLSYSKGASLIRMMDHFLTTDTFQRGIRNYLLEHQYGNAEQDDLWRHLTKVGTEDNTLPQGVTVNEIMNTWTLQKHYPVVNIHRHGNGSTTISQKPFVEMQSNSIMTSSSPDNTSTSSSPNLWWIPLSVLAEGSPDIESTTVTIWLPPKSKSMLVAGLPSHPRWVLLNGQQTAYTRINYDQRSWMEIIRQLNANHLAIPATTRAQLLDDAFHLFLQGELKTPDVLFTMMGYMDREDEYLPWVITMRNMEDIHDHLLYQPEFFELKTYLLKLSDRLYFKFGLEREVQYNLKGHFSVRAQEWTCKLNQKECTDDLLRYFKKWQQQRDIEVVPKRLRADTLCTGIREGNSTLWDSLWGEALALPRKSKHRSTLLSALGCSKEPWTLKRYLVESFKQQEALGQVGLFQVVKAVSKNPVSYDYAWEIINNKRRFIERYTDKPLPPFVVAASILTLSKERHLEELVEYLNVSPQYTSSQMRKMVRKVESNIIWLQRYHAPIASWLVNHYPFNDVQPTLPALGTSRRSFRTPRKLNIRLID